MSTNKNFEEIMKEILSEETQLIIDEYEKSIEDVEKDFPSGIDENILRMVIEYDNKQREKKKKQFVSVLSKVAVFAIVCVAATTFLFPEHVEAFRTRVFDMFFNDEAGSVSLRGENELDMIGDWTDYYYPEYMPEGYKLIGAEKMGEIYIMLYTSEDGEHQLNMQTMPDNSTISIDTDMSSIEDVKIGYHEGIYSVNEEYNKNIITWVSDKKIVYIQGDNTIHKDEYIKIAENVRYIER